MLTLDKVNALALEASANALVINALTRGAPGVPAPPRGEVKAAHAIVIAGSSQVAAAWSPILAPSQYRIDSTSVLIHGTPMVRFHDAIAGKNEKRELGDLLIVVDMISGAAVIDRRAELVQAKLAKQTGHISLDASGKAQRNLYLQWPPFTMPNGYQPHARDLNDASCQGSATDGCRFGGIDLHGSPRDWTQIPTAQRMSARGKPRLGTTLMHMACGNAGRQAVKGGTDPWSELVDELMAVTLNVNYPAGKGPRRSWHTVSFISLSSPAGGRVHSHTAFVDHGSVPPEDGSEEVEEMQPQGISLIHLQLASTEEEG